MTPSETANIVSAAAVGLAPDVARESRVDDAGANVLAMFPPGVRRVIYAVYGLLALIGTAMTAYYGALPGLAVPDQLMGGMAALGALAAPMSVLAASNVKK